VPLFIKVKDIFYLKEKTGNVNWSSPLKKEERPM
jgi:hypothetical protein